METVPSPTAILAGSAIQIARARGALWFALGSILWASVNPLVKVLVQTVPVEQILWARFVGHLLISLACFGPRTGWAVWKSAQVGTQMLRSVLLLALASCNFIAVSYLPVAQAVAIMFTFPFFVCLLSGPLLREPAGLRDWAAVSVGFLGVLALVKPGASASNVGLVFAVGAALLFALVQILTRKLGSLDPPSTTQLYTALVGTLALAPLAVTHWVSPTPREWLLLAGTAACTASGIYCVILGQARAPAALVAPLAYLQVVTCVIYDVAVFGSGLDALDVLGVLGVIGAGVYTTAGGDRRSHMSVSGTEERGDRDMRQGQRDGATRDRDIRQGNRPIAPPLSLSKFAVVVEATGKSDSGSRSTGFAARCSPSRGKRLQWIASAGIL